MGDLSGWKIVNDSQPVTQKGTKGDLSDWIATEQPEEEGLGTSLLYALPRIAEDLGKSAYEGIKKAPEYWETAKKEVPGFLNPFNQHPISRAKQGLAGLYEANNMLNQLPSNLAQYASNRLHLLPKEVPEAIKAISPEDTSQTTNRLFDKPKYPGEALLRGTARNLPNILPGVEGLSNLKKLTPSNALRGNLTPEELLDNLRITQGTETGLGDVIGSPMLKRLNENILSKIPFSGVNESMQRTAGHIINRGHDIIEQLASNSNVEDLDKYLHDALKESYKSHQGEKNAHYANVNNSAKQLGLELDLPNFAQKVKQHKNAIEDTNILKYEPDMQSLLRKLGGYENPVKSETTTGKIVDEFGKPLLNQTKVTRPSFEEANLLKGKLNQLANQHGASSLPSDRHLAGVFGDLARTLKGDIEGAIEKSGHEQLKKEYKAAEENYAKKFSPFLDKQIYKFINGNADPETLISSFIKTGKSTDRANLIKKVTDKLPMEDRNLLGYGYLQRAMDENNVLNPLKLKTLLSKNALGNKQFEALFPNPVLRNALRDYVSLVDKNTKGLKLMQNPDTGQMNMDILPLISKSPMGFVSKLMGAPLIAKKLRSEKTRTKLVNKMVDKSR